MPYAGTGTEGGIGELMDTPVQVDSPVGNRSWPVREVEHVGGTGVVEADGETGGAFPARARWAVTVAANA
ncbi:hypothetical protein ACFXPQ_18870 [Streptomyces lydicus]|uniref:hypothetical protein n=1 Tax=Streptomyces lydicus TaxID=47763 RepID=UPI0036A45C98